MFCKVEVTKSGIMIVHGSILLNTTAHPKDIIPKRGLITGAKIVIFLEKSKKKSLLGCFLFIDGDFSRAEPREHNSREEGERQYRMYQSDRKGTEGN